MGIPLRDDDNIEKDSIPFLLLRLSKIAEHPTHHSAAKARKLHDGWRTTLTKAQALAWKKRTKLFLKQEESNSSFDRARPWK